MIMKETNNVSWNMQDGALLSREMGNNSLGLGEISLRPVQEGF